MAAISSASPPPPPPPSPNNLRRRNHSISPLYFSLRRRRPLSISSRLYSSRGPSSSFPNASSNGSNGGAQQYQLHHLPPQFLPLSGQEGAQVYVTLPADSARPGGHVARRKALGASLLALAAAGVEGVSIEFWWGVVERDSPGVYDWGAYVDLVNLASKHGLKVRAIMAFHQHCNSDLGEACVIPLPGWVMEEMEKEPDLAYSDRFGRRNKEYISLGCDLVPVVKGRSPIQAYSDFMRSFRDNFRDLLGVVITEIQVGMGPDGELRYPSISSEKLSMPSSTPELGEFQCYDKYMLASLNAYACQAGKREWGNGGPLGASKLLQNPEETTFFKSDGSWNSAYGRFFLKWYSEMLLLHGERLCMASECIFWGTGVRLSAKVAGIYWHYATTSHPSELTAGYYNTLVQDGYLPIARMFGRYRMALCCTCFDLRDEEAQDNSRGSPEGILRQLISAARECNLPLSGENTVNRFDDTSLQQIVNSSRLYSAGCSESSLSFNFVRMNKHMFQPNNWSRFARFVRQMSDARTFHAKVDFRSAEAFLPCTSFAEDLGRIFA